MTKEPKAGDSEQAAAKVKSARYLNNGHTTLELRAGKLVAPGETFEDGDIEPSSRDFFLAAGHIVRC